MESEEPKAMESDEWKAAEDRADDVAAKLEARGEELDRKLDYFADDRAAELDRAVANAEAVAKGRKAQVREQIRSARAHAPRGKGKRPAE